MANVAAQLGNLLGVNADINYYTQQSIYWNAKYEANSEKLKQQVNYEQKWQSAFDDAQDTDKTCKIGNTTWKKKDEVLSDAQADAYAHAKVKQYDEELSMELADLDIEYEAMKTTYEAMLEELRAQQEADKQATSTAAQDTGLLGQ